MLVLTFPPRLLDGRSTMLIVPGSTTKCELQFFYPYNAFLMSFSFLEPIPPSIVVPHYAYLDLKVRYIPTPSSGMSVEYYFKIRQLILLMLPRLRMQVRSSSYCSAITDLGLRWCRIIPSSSSNKHLYNSSYCYHYPSRCLKKESKHWGNCWGCRWRCCRYRTCCRPNRFYNHAPSQVVHIKIFHIQSIYITTNYDG
jgi:hypothetical protein